MCWFGFFLFFSVSIFIKRSERKELERFTMTSLKFNSNRASKVRCCYLFYCRRAPIASYVRENERRTEKARSLEGKKTKKGTSRFTMSPLTVSIVMRSGDKFFNIYYTERWDFQAGRLKTQTILILFIGQDETVV